MNKPWSTLPNAHHIDWVLASVKENPELWEQARRASIWGPLESIDEAMRTVSAKVYRRHAWYEASFIATKAAWLEVASSVTALIAYDDCDQYLALGYEKLKVYAVLGEKPQAILLLPMVYVREKINEQALVYLT
jgi:hypothetical protein